MLRRRVWNETTWEARRRGEDVKQWLVACEHLSQHGGATYRSNLFSMPRLLDVTTVAVQKWKMNGKVLVYYPSDASFALVPYAFFSVIREAVSLQKERILRF